MYFVLISSFTYRYETTKLLKQMLATCCMILKLWLYSYI